MAAFDPGADLSGDRAFRLLTNTSVTLFWRPQILDETIAWLSDHGYQIIRVDAAHWSTEADLHRDIAAAFSFPDYYGHNLDALNDCMRDVVSQDYGWTPHTTGLVLVFADYDAFATRCPSPAQAVLDIMAEHSRSASLFGHRLMCLVHSNDPRIHFAPVGATPVMWNDAEWLDSKRRPDGSATSEHL
ncbi:barnase inhibitor [Saccharothrix syringae]|uniref:Barnase inhibitor n=2 Tax=Saccharothrix syringae TaxID=103733 RepID=A0A5Q0GXR2_SACSY|nr:barnase inhibitor [Saccharothrix syringae]